MTRKNKNPNKLSEVSPSSKSKSKIDYKKFIRTKWFPPVIFLILSLLYFAPCLGFNKIIMGSDDGPRGWYTVGNHGHSINKFFDKWSPLNGGTAVMERRFGRFINPMHLFHLFLKKYKARTIEYIFWTFFAGLMMFIYLTSIGISKPVSYTCSIAFMFAPAFQSYVLAGHFVKMEVVSFIPGIMYFTERILKKISLIDLVGLPILLSIGIYSRHLQLVYFISLGMAIYFSVKMIYMAKTKQVTIHEGLKRSAVFAGAIIIVTFITSMNTFPSMHHTNVTSKRAGGVDYEYASSFALHPEEIFSLVQPDFIGWGQKYWGQNPLKLNSEYFGVCFLILAIMLFFIKKQDFTKYLLAGLFIFAILFSIGAHTPLHKILYHIMPGVKSFRAPSMMNIWFFFTGIVLAAFCLEKLCVIKLSEADPALKKRLLIFMGVIAGFMLIYLLSSSAFSKFWYNSIYPAEFQSTRKFNTLMFNLKYIKLGSFLIFIFTAAFFTITYLKITGKIGKKTFLIIFLAICLFDLIRVSRPFFNQALKPANFYKGQEEIEHSIEKYLHRKDNSIYRVHSIMGDQKLFIPGLDMTYVFDDFTNQRYNDITDIIRNASYMLQQPKSADNRSIKTGLKNALSLLNTKYIISFSKLDIPGIKQLINSGGLRIYKNNDAFPRFFLADHPVPASDTKSDILKLINKPFLDKNTVIVNENALSNIHLNPAVDTSIQDNVLVINYNISIGKTKLEIKSQKEQFLVICENYNPGWKAKVNNKPADVLLVNYYAKGIIVPQGKSIVELTYQSEIALLWRKVTLISAILFLIFSVYTVVRYKFGKYS